MTFLLFSCVKEPVIVDDKVVLEGDLINERTGENAGIPFMYSYMRLYSSWPASQNNMLGYVEVRNKGHYQLIINATTGQQAYLVLVGDPGSRPSWTLTPKAVVLDNKVKLDYILPCTAELWLEPINKSGAPYDSIRSLVMNSDGTRRADTITTNKRHFFLLPLRGGETNTITTKFYRNGNFTQRLDTFTSVCNKYYQYDTLNY